MGKRINYEQREKILKISYKLFLEYEYNQVTTRMIAKECGMERSLLYHYYDKKEKLILDVYLDIVREADNYFRRTLTPEQLERMDVGMLFHLVFEMINIKPAYANILTTIYWDAKLIGNLLKFTIENSDFFGMAPFPREKQLAMFMICGGLSQLLLSYYNNELGMTTREMINYVMRSYYLNLGTSDGEAQELIALMNGIVDEQYVRDFIDYYEGKMM